MDVRAVVRQGADGRWTGIADPPVSARATAATPERCVAALRRAVERSASIPKHESLTLIAETVPRLAGVAEAAEIMGWDKRRVVTYIDRGSFPEPAQTLASGRVWLRSDVEAYATAWRARRQRRARHAR
ncbi:MAG TPA: hypothetical protein VGH10_13315 [Actinomycetota bacterium]|jgi:hypothetical protein